MSLNETDRREVESFLAWIEEAFRPDGRFDPIHPKDPEVEGDPSGLERCLMIGPRTWVQVVASPDKGGLTVALATRDRTVSEAVEGNSLQLGDSFEELLEDGLEDAGEEDTYAVDHYHDSGAFFFESKLPLEGGWSDLKSPEVRDKARKLILGYCLGFGRFFLDED